VCGIDGNHCQPYLTTKTRLRGLRWNELVIRLSINGDETSYNVHCLFERESNFTGLIYKMIARKNKVSHIF
jgi:hypothetical protein